MAGRFGLNICLLWAGIAALASSSTLSPPSTTPASTETNASMHSETSQTSTHSSPNLSSNQSLSSTVSTASALSPPPTTPASTKTNATTDSETPQTSTHSPLDAPSNQSLSSTVSTAATPNANRTTASPTTKKDNLTQTTVQPQTTSNATTQTPSPPECSYTLAPIQYGFQIKIKNSLKPQNYTLTLVDQGGESQKEEIRNATFDIEGLKPCTNYRHNLSFTLSNMKRFNCQHSRPSETTGAPNTTDFEKTQRIGEKLCYKTKWNIGPKPNNQICLDYESKDICKQFTKKVSEYCNVSFTLSDFIPLESSDINLEVLKEYPAKITATLPPNCGNSTVTYNCSEKEGSNKNVSLDQLEPYTNYICTATVMYENGTLTKDTDVRIDCELQIKHIGTPATTNTSVNLSWSLDSSICGDNLNYSNLKYDWTCDKAHEGVKFVSKCPAVPYEVSNLHAYTGYNSKCQEVPCEVSNLQAYTNYSCEICVYYNSALVNSSNILIETQPGKPDKPQGLSPLVTERNRIKVKWIKPKEFRGPKHGYTVRLYEGGTLKNTTNTTKTTLEFEDLSYSTEYEVEVTANNGHCESDPVSRKKSTTYNEKPLIGFLVFLIILTSLALIFVTYKIYILKREKSRDSSESMNLIPKTSHEDKLMSVEPLTAETLLDAYKRKIADEGRLFLAEFQTIPRIFSKYPVKEAKKFHNGPKNRYVDILPYDYNRVQLTTGNGSPGCDYINASFINGFKESKKYIAAQGPKEETVGDFWRMIWEQQTSIIVMVSRCEEGNRVKCAQYWPSPDRDTEIFEEFIVKLTLEDHYPDYIIRHLSLTNKRDKGVEREVTHIQFVSWPDHGVPDEAHLLLKLRRRVNSFKNFFSGPIVIHCSAGVGRTGTFIGIDAMMESLEVEGRADIYAYVVMLRRQRCLMVQVEAQYILIHQALLEHTQFGETESLLQELHSTLSTLKQRTADNESTLMEDEFDRLPIFKSWRTCNTGKAEENKKKNRTSSVVPYDYNRVQLKSDEGQSHESDADDDYEEASDEDNEDSAKYINASLISGYWGPHAFVAAQTPLADTVADFWSMILQYKVPAVVMLSDCSQTDEDCLYWGEGKKTYEDIEVELESTDSSPTFTLRTMLIHHQKTKERHQVKHFQFLKWGNRELPEKPQDLVDLIKEIEYRCGLRWPSSTPVVIHCNDGSSRCGILCGLWNLLESAKKEKAVDVFQVVKTLRKERQRMFSSLEQYQFLYDALEVVFPVQNGDVKAAQNSVQIVNETKAAEKPSSTTRPDPQGTEDSADGAVSAPTQEEDSKSPTEEV